MVCSFIQPSRWEPLIWLLPHYSSCSVSTFIAIYITAQLPLIPFINIKLQAHDRILAHKYDFGLHGSSEHQMVNWSKSNLLCPWTSCRELWLSVSSSRNSDNSNEWFFGLKYRYIFIINWTRNPQPFLVLKVSRSMIRFVHILFVSNLMLCLQCSGGLLKARCSMSILLYAILLR